MHSRGSCVCNHCDKQMNKTQFDKAQTIYNAFRRTSQEKSNFGKIQVALDYLWLAFTVYYLYIFIDGCLAVYYCFVAGWAMYWLFTPKCWLACLSTKPKIGCQISAKLQFMMFVASQDRVWFPDSGGVRGLSIPMYSLW